MCEPTTYVTKPNNTMQSCKKEQNQLLRYFVVKSHRAETKELIKPTKCVLIKFSCVVRRKTSSCSTDPKINSETINPEFNSFYLSTCFRQKKPIIIVKKQTCSNWSKYS